MVTQFPLSRDGQIEMEWPTGMDNALKHAIASCKRGIALKNDQG